MKTIDKKFTLVVVMLVLSGISGKYFDLAVLVTLAYLIFG